jgi:hypothetical protein
MVRLVLRWCACLARLKVESEAAQLRHKPFFDRRIQILDERFVTFEDTPRSCIAAVVEHDDAIAHAGDGRTDWLAACECRCELRDRPAHVTFGIGVEQSLGIHRDFGEREHHTGESECLADVGVFPRGIEAALTPWRPYTNPPSRLLPI